MLVLAGQARGGEAVANSARATAKPAPDEDCDAGQQYAQKHRVPGMPRPAEIGLIGDEGQDGDDRTHGDDEAVLLANAAREYDGRQAPDQYPRGPVERPCEFGGGPSAAPPPHGRSNDESWRLMAR